MVHYIDNSSLEWLEMVDTKVSKQCMHVWSLVTKSMLLLHVTMYLGHHGIVITDKVGCFVNCINYEIERQQVHDFLNWIHYQSNFFFWRVFTTIQHTLWFENGKREKNNDMPLCKTLSFINDIICSIQLMLCCIHNTLLVAVFHTIHMYFLVMPEWRKLKSDWVVHVTPWNYNMKSLDKYKRRKYFQDALELIWNNFG